MAVENGVILLGITFLMAFLLLQKQHPIWAGFFYIAIGAASYLVQAANNPYGIIIIVLGIVSILTAKWDGAATRA